MFGFVRWQALDDQAAPPMMRIKVEWMAAVENDHRDELRAGNKFSGAGEADEIGRALLDTSWGTRRGQAVCYSAGIRAQEICRRGLRGL